MAIEPIQRLRSDLLRISKSLSQSYSLLLPPEEQEALHGAALRLAEKLSSLTHSLLNVGLLGGTGVGKSSIMNALAGESIASTSHRRPHTHQVLIYHHHTALLPSELEQATVPWQAITHNASSIQQIVLCDLPDFDSILTQNREKVLNFLEHLDVLVWVTSPEKYGDASFYEFLSATPKARQNFYFVLNKADLLFQAENVSAGYQPLLTVTSSFQQHIAQQGIIHPLLYTISTREVLADLPLSPWNQFPALRAQLFQQRDTKEILAIKAANIDEEVRHLLSSVQQKLLATARLQQVVDGLNNELEELHRESTGLGRNLLSVWARRDLQEQLEKRPVDPALLIGPGRWLALLQSEWQRWVQAPRGIAETGRPGSWEPGVDLTNRLREIFCRVENRILKQLLRQALPQHFIERLRHALNVDEAWGQFVEKLKETIDARLLEPSPGRISLRGLGFQVFQFCTYCLCFLVFFLVLAGQNSWTSVLQQPGFASLLNMVLAGVYNLFGPNGLAALGSYTVLQVFFAFQFLSRHKKLLQRQNQKFIDSLTEELGKMWEIECNRPIVTFAQLRQELQDQASAIATLWQEPDRE